MLNQEFREKTTPLMRPQQAEKVKDEAAVLTNMLSAPPHISSAIENRGQVHRHLQSLKRDLEKQVPLPYQGSEIDSANNRERVLRETITQGMPTQAEMRKNPPGAVDKHRMWQHYKKSDLLEWKNIRLRQHAGGDVEHLPFARDVANFERYRPTGGAQELSMDGAQITGKQYHLPPAGAAPVVVMTDEKMKALQELDPELAGKMAVLGNAERADVLELIDILMERKANLEMLGDLPQPVKETKKSKGGWSPERRAEMSARAKQRWADKKSKELED